MFFLPTSNCLAKTFIFLLLCVNFFGQTPPPQSTELELNKPVEREFSGTQRHRYQVNLTANQYLKIQIEQRGIDVAARLYGADDKLIADFDVEMRPIGSETIEFIPATDGVYKFDIVTRYPLLPAGKYEIRLAELHPATEKVKTQQEARNLYAESIRQFNAGKYSDAKTAIQRSVEINKNEFGLENLATILTLTQLARTLDAMGDYDEAINLNQQVLKLREKVLGAEHPDLAINLNYIASIYNRKEDFKTAIEYHQKALALREKVFQNGHPIVSVSLINLGLVWRNFGDEVKAKELYERALLIQEKTVGLQNFNTAVINNNIGEIYNDLGEFDKAAPYFQKAVAILESIFSPDNPRVFDVLVNLANTYTGKREFDKAEQLFKRILASREKSYKPDHPLVANALFNLANVLALKKDYNQAELLFRRALQICENKFGGESTAVSEVASGLALLFANKGDIDQSLKFQQRSNEIDEKNISLNLNIGSERQKLAYLNNLIDRTNQSLFIQAKFAPENDVAIELAVTTVLRQKGRVLDAVANNLTELRRRSTQPDKELLDKFNRITQQISELIINGAEDTPIADHQAKIKSLTDERERLENEISQRVAGFFQKSQPVSLQEIQSAIPADFALLEFATYKTENDSGKPEKSRYVVYILKNQGQIKWKDLGETEQIDGEINRFRQALGDPKRQDIQQLARQLDEKIMSPIRSILGNSKQLFISPDGNFNLIPFEALFDEKNQYLVENYTFTYLTSGRDLLRLKMARPNKNNPLLIANPTFGEPDSGQLATVPKSTPNRKRRSITATRNLSDTYFAPLSGTIQEARSILTFFPEATFLTQKDATETKLKEATAPLILHIATHGFFLEDNQNNGKIENPLLRSGLALAGANQRKAENDDGILTALEASGLNLWGTKLVVLSACDTGLGEVKNGEGVYGLRRAFALAGTETLVMSLWSVSDLVTRELMTGYYKNLKQGLGRGAALRQVQLEMLKKPTRRHPFYWASFIQSGEWGSLESKK